MTEIPPAGSASYPPPPTYPAPPIAPSNGALAWGLGFLAFLPIPGLNVLAAAIAMAAAYPSQRGRGEVAEGNARNAANWGLTYLTVSIVSVLLTIVLAVSFGDEVRGFFPIGLPLLVFFAAGAVHVILLIMGLVKASRGAVLRVPVAIPFIRA